MAQVTAIITKIIMDEDYHVYFYDQYNYVVQTLQTDTYVEVVGSYLVCGSNGDSIKFYANTVELIEGPTFSQSYTPLPAGFFQQGSQYFERLSAMYDYIKTNVVNVVVRDISALKFRDGTTQTTAAGGGGGSGTVTSIGFTEGTGIDITGTNPITTSGNITITNTAPDQVVTMTDGTGIDVTGTYPNFTVTNTAPDQTVVLTDGTGIDVTGTYPSFTITNTAPDQTVSLTEGTGIDVTGTYPSFTIANTAPDQTVTLTDGTAIDVTGTYPNFTINNTAPDQVVTLTEGANIDITGTYPNFTIASTVSGGIPKGTTSGTDTYTTTITGVTGYNDGDAYLIRFVIGNTTVATLNINSLGPIPLYRNNDGELIGGDIIDGAEMLCVYNSTTNRFQVIGTAPNTLLAYVTNADTVAIVKGQPVYAFGGQGDRLTVKRASNILDSTSAQTVGLVLSTSISINGKGLIILNGQLDGLSNLKPSAGWADGDAVYLGATAGTITNIKPHAPNHLVYLGFVTTANSGSAGRMYVRVQNGYELEEIHDVSAQFPDNNDGLFYNSTTELWENKSIVSALGYVPQSQLDSGVNIKTINGDSIVGSGNELVFNYDRARFGIEGFSDFISPAATNNAIDPSYTVFTQGAGATALISTAPSVRATNQQGFIQPATGTTATGAAGIFSTTSGNNFLALGGGAFSFTTSILIPTLSTSLERYRIVVGIGTSAINASDPTGIFFTYDEGGIQNGTSPSPNWQCITAVSNVRTLNVTSVAANTTAWQKFTIEVNAASTSVQFYIDNVLVATHSTNVPTGVSQAIIPKIQIAKSIGLTSRSFFADYFGYKQTFTTPRI